ncbi:hypothetical protein DP939_09910 [Spongiactinospora rosea]|uniref:Uncharacterized protein n=1 Tax=Spongiactinospora rosea TaxID=2248750 RepID=A0A366M273_9ACTN|nr:hypothetical protein [Spongiactinospora rosea]RBQ20127.1 hypothetical protein DP939_09910 [Spongiactinospora rosea]
MAGRSRVGLRVVTSMGDVARLVVVHDAGCGGCSVIAGRLAAVLAVPVVVRSCRDPGLAAEYPVPPRAGCGAPLAVAVDGNGRMRVWRGLALPLRMAGLVAPGRRGAAVRLALHALGQHLRRKVR